MVNRGQVRECVTEAISCSGSITSVGEERASLSAIVYLLLCGFCSERLPLDAWDGLCYFIVVLPEHSI